MRKKAEFGPSFKKSSSANNARKQWNRMKKNTVAILDFLKLRIGEKPFVRYDNDGLEIKNTSHPVKSPSGYFKRNSRPCASNTTTNPSTRSPLLEATPSQVPEMKQ